jgi:hypothetical protein
MQSRFCQDTSEHGGSDKTAEEQQKKEAMEFKSKHLKNEHNSSFRVNR